MTMNLYEMIQSLHNNNAISMHVPGHKNNTIGNLSKFDLSYDMTEIEPLDNLHDPSDVLKRLNDVLSEKFPTHNAYAMVNGSTNGILASMHMMKMNNRTKCIILGEAHKSVYNGLSLLNLTYTETKHIDDTDIDENTFVIVTSPTYTGNISDITAIATHTHRHNGILIVDEAHGAHFNITKRFPRSSSTMGADIVVQSYHKTLPALTGASVLFIDKNLSNLNALESIQMFETSSPSYLTMLSIEEAQNFYNNYNDEEFFSKRALIIKMLQKNHFTVTETDDPVKIILNYNSESPYTLNRSLIDQHIYSEMTTDEGVLWCLPLFHKDDRYPLQALLERLEGFTISAQPSNDSMDLSILINKKCITSIVPYPPGIPLVKKDEMIEAQHVETLLYFVKNRVKIEGIRNNLDYYSHKED